jgi:hypothetical protein
MGQEEDNIPVCDVFKGDEAFWTEKYTGESGRRVRGNLKAHEGMPESTKLGRSKKISVSLREYNDNMLPEERARLTEKVYLGLNSMSEEAKLIHSDLTAKGAKRAYEAMGRAKQEELREARSKMWEDMPLSKKLVHGDLTSKGMANMTDLAKDIMRENISKGGIEVWEGSSVIKRLARSEAKSITSQGRSQFYRDFISSSISKGNIEFREAMSDSDKDYRSFLISEGMESRTLEEKLAWRSRLSETCKAFWIGLSDEEKSSRALKAFKAHNTITEANFPEFFLGIFLEVNFPGEWAYNGQGQQSLSIGG